VLVIGRIFQASAVDNYVRDAITTQNELYVAIGRFTPASLFQSYITTIEELKGSVTVGMDYSGNVASGVWQVISTIGNVTLGIALAAPNTVITLYGQASGMTELFVLAGFCIGVSAVLAWLLATKTSLWRLLLASAASPFAISVVFLALQAFMALMLDAFFWFTLLAQYAVVCPLLCTAYWIARPHADRGATATVARAIGRALDRRA
jgi:hypothetical protein